MCGLSQNSGLGKVLDKAHTAVNKVSPGAKLMDKTKRAVHGDEFVDQGGYRSMFYKDYQSKDEKKREGLLASAPKFGTPEYAEWYKNNKQSLLDT